MATKVFDRLQKLALSGLHVLRMFVYIWPTETKQT